LTLSFSDIFPPLSDVFRRFLTFSTAFFDAFDAFDGIFSTFWTLSTAFLDVLRRFSFFDVVNPLFSTFFDGCGHFSTFFLRRRPFVRS